MAAMVTTTTMTTTVIDNDDDEFLLPTGEDDASEHVPGDGGHVVHVCRRHHPVQRAPVAEEQTM